MIAINDSWKLFPAADVLYGCDGDWWKAHKGVSEFKRLKLTHDATACVSYPDLNQIVVARRQDRILLDEPCVVGDGGNSGFQALNLAVQFGAIKIILVGFDMRVDRGIHWHGKHENGLNNPSDYNLPKWRKTIDGAAQGLREIGVKVINTSPVSALTAYPVMNLREALRCSA